MIASKDELKRKIAERAARVSVKIASSVSVKASSGLKRERTAGRGANRPLEAHERPMRNR